MKTLNNPVIYIFNANNKVLLFKGNKKEFEKWFVDNESKIKKYKKQHIYIDYGKTIKHLIATTN